MTSDTPRTNAKAWMIVDCDECVVLADFARELERELAAAIKERDALKQRVAELKSDSDILDREEACLERLAREGGGACGG